MEPCDRAWKIHLRPPEIAMTIQTQRPPLEPPLEFEKPSVIPVYCDRLVDALVGVISGTFT
jgi:hypothetical protein